MRSLYARIFLSYWLVMAAIVAGAILVTWLVVVERQESLPRVSVELVGQAARELRAGGEPALRDWLRRQRTPGFRVFVVDESGRELLDRPLPPHLQRRLQPRGPYHEPPGIRVLAPQPVPLLLTEQGRRYAVLVVRPPSQFGPLGIPETRWAVLVVALLATGVASWLLARSVTRPVKRISAATRAIAEGNLDARVLGRVQQRRDELGELARDFDGMAERLRELLRAKERLLRDISHELRSPLARMRVALGLARQPGGDVGRQLDRLEVETERLDRLIGQVLHLSRLDARASTVARDEVDLADLVDGIAADAAFEAQALGVQVEFAPPAAPVRVRADAQLLASAVENVVRNALRYTAPGTAVTLDVSVAGGEARVRVRDRGPGVPESELERIFEPFHRVAESRERGSGGDGIGLAITARVLAAHGGRAVAANAADGGLVVTLSLPA